MNKTIILSVRPEHAIKILKGEKTLELRKSVPKGYKGWVYCYVTKGKPYITMQSTRQFTLRDDNGYTNVINGTILFRFWFDEYEYYNSMYFENTGIKELNYLVDGETRDKLCLEDDTITTYGKGKPLYAWHIKNLDILSKPMQLEEFVKDFPYASRDVVLSEIKNQKLRITKAPQSYQYAWIKEEELK